MTTTRKPTSEEKVSSPRRGRPPRGAALLGRELILDAALQVVDTDGVEALTMRSVATRLGVDPKSLYNHVDSKDALLDGVAERILSSIEIPAPTGALDADLRAIATAFRKATMAHPQAATLVLTRQLSSPAGLAPIEAVVSLLTGAGATPEEAVHLLRTLVAGLVGTLLREAYAGPTFGVSDPGVSARRDVVANSGLPGLTDIAPHIARFDREQEFDYAVDLMIEAVTGRLGGRT